jgi:molybdopterin-guanine dinucleotide biosynthesis protein B
MRTPPVFCVVGRSNTGKTTLIERLIPVLASKGVRVATIKHHDRPFEMDLQGKDTYRHKSAGAKAAMIVSDRKLGLVKDLEREMHVDELVARYMDDVDLVIVEGYKQEPLPKIEVYNYRENDPPVAAEDEFLVAIVADAPVPAAVPVFLRDDIEAIAAFIMQKFELER